MAAYLGLSLTVVDKVGVLPSATETACSGGGRRLNEGRTVCDMPREVGPGGSEKVDPGLRRGTPALGACVVNVLSIISP